MIHKNNESLKIFVEMHRSQSLISLVVTSVWQAQSLLSSCKVSHLPFTAPKYCVQSFWVGHAIAGQVYTILVHLPTRTPVVQGKIIDTIHQINHYPVDNVVCLFDTHMLPLDSILQLSNVSCGFIYQHFEQLGPGVFSVFTSHVIKTKNRNHSINKFKNLEYDR